MSSNGTSDDGKSNDPAWSRLGDFVNIMLGIAVARSYISCSDVVFDGIAGEQFDKAIAGGGEEAFLEIAVKLEAPGLGGLSPRLQWVTVTALCKASVVEKA